MSNNIREYRLEKGLTQTQLSYMVEISCGYLCHLEKGTRINPSVEIMKKFSMILNKPISDIFML